MKSIVAIFALAPLCVAWGSVEFCRNRPDVNTGYECATYTFEDDGCFDLPDGDGSFGHPKLQGNTHFVAPSDGLSCHVFGEVGCEGSGSLGLSRGSFFTMLAISSARCHDKP